MELMEALKLGGKGKVEIPNCSRQDLPKLFKDLGFKVGAEIGAYKGVFTKKFCEVGLKVYAIDPWLPYEGYHNSRTGFDKRSEYLHKLTKRRLAPYDCEVIRKMSMDAVKDFEDDSLDFVYIDGNHSLKYVVEDIHEWAFKVKDGGIISGHDYALSNTIRVKYAVDALTRAYNISPWFVLGSMNKASDEEVRDKWRSWMWVNKKHVN